MGMRVPAGAAGAAARRAGGAAAAKAGRARRGRAVRPGRAPERILASFKTRPTPAAGLLLGLALLAVASRPACAAEEPSDRFYVIPDVKPYPAVGPVDAGYPGNIPKDLPTSLPAPPAVLAPGPAAACGTSVEDVLLANKRTSFITLLSASAEGRAVLAGKMAATVLAPTDAAIAGLQLLGRNADPLSLSTVAHYHVMQGKLSLDQLLAEPGLWLNTTLTKADCPTAYQTLVVMPGNGTTVRCARARSRGRARSEWGPSAHGVGRGGAACGCMRPRRWVHGSWAVGCGSEGCGCTQAGEPAARPAGAGSRGRRSSESPAAPPRCQTPQAHPRGVRPRRREHGAHHGRRPAGVQQRRAPHRRGAAAVLHLGV
jgi:hypothetical protein